ncbi:MAG TPA: ROK family protein [Allosphingosinicella sp.]|jgi:fructokinase
MRLAGVELGGTKCVCTLATGPEDVIDQRTVPTTTPEETLGAIEAVLRGWMEDGGFAALGIASFGPVDLDPASPTWGYITATPKPGWQRIDIAPRLRAAFGVPVAFDTDVNGAALAEMRWGAGRGLSDFAYITVGTGVGVGLVVNGAPTRGFQHCELGHVRVARVAGDDWPGACPYHGGCVEGLAAGGAIKARLGVEDASGLLPEHPVWETVAHAITQLCHTIVCAAAPRRIVIGGGVVSGQPHLLGRIEPMLVESLAGYMLLPEEAPYVTAPGLGDMAGPLGAIALAASA